MASMIVVGLMSGTSADGVDAAVVDIRGTGHRLAIKLLGHYGRSYPPRLRQHILHVAERGTVAEVCHLNAWLGEVFAKTVHTAITRSQVSPKQVKLIGSHGQTVHHLPVPKAESGVGTIRSTLQIGDPAVIAERTGITTVSDFRTRDLAAGGEGAPLVPYTHFLVFRQKKATRWVVNLGGIANVTVIPRGERLASVQAFDTGPCNMLLDALVALGTNGRTTIDRGGRFAQRGHVHPGLLRWLLAHPYLHRPPPKSTGRELFGESYVQKVLAQARRRHLSLHDLLATGCQFIAHTIRDAQQWTATMPADVVFGGGGVRNARLWGELLEIFDRIPVRRMDDCGSSSQAFEAQAFAVLAYQTLQGVCANVPRVTGARHPVILGSVTPGTRGFSKR
ncbi:MAG: anhydro-N-acetylmuramic acid kinase [Nitrospirota bacterium]|nr:anhydro-N-acetylmuramic acid kinase [Nitrospirota bacterium]